VKQQHVMYILACQHVAMSAPNLVNFKMQVWCPQCSREVRVWRVHEYEWHARCLNCTFGRWSGLSEESANHMADVHGRARTHKVVVEYVRNPAAIEEAVRLANSKAV
jgi:hypothetical protein